MGTHGKEQVRAAINATDPALLEALDAIRAGLGIRRVRHLRANDLEIGRPVEEGIVPAPYIRPKDRRAEEQRTTEAIEAGDRAYRGAGYRRAIKGRRA